MKPIMVTGIMISAMILEAGCSSSTAPAAASASLGSTVSTAIKTASSGSPHVVTSSTVTSQNDRFQNNGEFRWGKSFWDWAFPNALASALGVSTVWDPNSGSAPVGSQLSFPNEYTQNSVISLKGYMGQQLDPNFQNKNGSSTTPFGRMQSALQITCALGYLVTAVDSDGTPSVGTLSFTIPTDTTNIVYQSFSSGGCNLQTNNAGTAISAVVTAVSGSTMFTKKMSLSMGNTSSLYLGFSSGALNFMNIEDQAPSGRNAVDRSIFIGTGMGSASTTKILFEYTSMGYNSTRGSGAAEFGSGQWKSDFEFDRIFIDGANDVAYLVSNNGDPGDASGGTGAPAKYIQFTGAARPVEMSSCTSSSCSETLALSFGFHGQIYASGGTDSAVEGVDFNGCVNAASRAIATDDSLACNVTGTAASAVAAMVESSRQFYIGTTSGIPNFLTNTTGTTALSFTGASDIYTTATTQ